MISLRLREEALDDLANIADYGASNHGWPAADGYLASIDGALEQLKRYPLSGIKRPELADNLRSLPFRQHHVFTCFRITISRSSEFCTNRWMQSGG